MTRTDNDPELLWARSIPPPPGRVVEQAPAPPSPVTPSPDPAPTNPPVTVDALTAMVGVGAPLALIVVCWGGSLLLSGTYVVRLFVAGGFTHVAAVFVAVLAAVVFAAAAAARQFAPDTARGLVTIAGSVVAAVWVAAVARTDAPAALALLVPAWSALSTTAGVRLCIARRGGTTHALYRFFDRTGRLLYVGRTHQRPGKRAEQHAADKWWWPHVASREVTWYPSHAALVAAEREAIIRERPMYNKVHNGRRTRGGRR
jgi:hypothetical protein